MNLEELVKKILGIGTPGLILLILVNSLGFVGAAALTSALAMLGGPLGMVGGIGVLVLMGLIAEAIGRYGFERIFCAVVDGLIQKGKSEHQIIGEIEGYPIGADLKAKLRDTVRTEFERRRTSK